MERLTALLLRLLLVLLQVIRNPPRQHQVSAALRQRLLQLLQTALLQHGPSALLSLPVSCCPLPLSLLL